MKKIFLLLLIFSLNSFASDFITPKQAAYHKGRTQTVCAKAVQVVSKNGITYVNFEKKYPNQTFYLFITQKENYIDLKKVAGKKICSHGKIELYKNIPMHKDPKSIMIMQ